MSEWGKPLLTLFNVHLLNVHYLHPVYAFLLHGTLLESILKFDVEGDTTLNFSGRMNSADVVLLQI